VGCRELAVDPEELEALDRRFRGNDAEPQIPVVGNGGISVTLRWRDGLVVKPLPDFPSRAVFEEYTAAIDAHVHALQQADVEVLSASVEALARPDGSWAAYIVQPEIASPLLLAEWLRAHPASEGLQLFDRLAGHVESAVAGRIGLDADVTNWCVDDGRLALLDISTPMLRDRKGRLAFDPTLFMQDLPRWFRPLARRYVQTFLVRRFFDRRLLFIDVLSGFKGEKLEGLLPEAVARASRNVLQPITEEDVERYRKRNERFWRAMGMLKRPVKTSNTGASHETPGIDRESNPSVRPGPS